MTPADNSTRHAPVRMEIPDIRTLLRHATPRFVEGTLVPLVLFLVGLRFLGVWAAMIAGLVWVYSAIGIRLWLRRPVPGLLALGAVTLTARTIVAIISHSVVVYFLQPSLGTMLVASAFLLSVPLDKPLAGRLAADFCPLPDGSALERTRPAVLPAHLVAVGVRADDERSAHDLAVVLAVALDVRRAAQRRLGRHDDHGHRGVDDLVQAQHASQRNRRSPARVAPGRGVGFSAMAARTLTTRDGFELAGQRRLVDGTPAAAVVIVHGFSASASCPHVEVARRRAVRRRVRRHHLRRPRPRHRPRASRRSATHEQHDVAAAVHLARANAATVSCSSARRWARSRRCATPRPIPSLRVSSRCRAPRRGACLATRAAFWRRP